MLSILVIITFLFLIITTQSYSMLEIARKFKVAIVGSGAAGLITGYALKSKNIDFKIFERSDCVGGVWKYRTDKPCAMYDSLRTNLPKEIMAFIEDFPFSDKILHSYVTHVEVQEYLENFANVNDLFPYIKFNSNINRILKTTENSCWNVYSSDSSSHEEFDAVVICNGHFNTPFIPNIKGINCFKGRQRHSYDYDTRDTGTGNDCLLYYADKTVLVVGTRSSGTDMSREIAHVAKTVIVSGRSLTTDITSEQNKNNNNIIHKGEILEFRSDGTVLFKDNTVMKGIDEILWCTGFIYDYPFLDKEAVSVVSNNKAVTPLYHQLFNVHDPTLSFIGLPYSVVPFPLFYHQATWVARVLAELAAAAVDTTGTALPCLSERLQWFEGTCNATGLGELCHYLGGDLQFEYMRYVSIQAGTWCRRMEEYIDMIQDIYNDNNRNKPEYIGAPDEYRDRDYTIDRRTLAWTVKPFNIGNKSIFK